MVQVNHIDLQLDLPYFCPFSLGFFFHTNIVCTKLESATPKKYINKILDFPREVSTPEVKLHIMK